MEVFCGSPTRTPFLLEKPPGLLLYWNYDIMTLIMLQWFYLPRNSVKFWKLNKALAGTADYAFSWSDKNASTVKTRIASPGMLEKMESGNTKRKDIEGFQQLEQVPKEKLKMEPFTSNSSQVIKLSWGFIFPDGGTAEFFFFPIIHSFPKETQHLWSCLSLGEECMPVNLELYIKTLCQGPDPGAPGKMDRLMLRFFWKRV